MNQNEDIIYESEFSIVPFIGLIIGISGFGYAGFILLENYKNIGGIILILPGLFFYYFSLITSQQNHAQARCQQCKTETTESE
jgi:hypothetical protein